MRYIKKSNSQRQKLEQSQRQKLDKSQNWGKGGVGHCLIGAKFQLGKMRSSGDGQQCWVQFSSVAQSCLTLCDPMVCNTPDLPLHHQIPQLAQTHVISSVVPFYSCLQPSPASGSFQMSQLSTSGGQNIGVSASASVLQMNIQD